MTPTDELRTELRELLDEEISLGSMDTDTRFTDDQIDAMLTAAHNVYAAAAAGWTRKAGKLQRELGQIEQSSVGQETYKTVNLSTAINYALTMAKTYREMAGPAQPQVSLVLGVAKPEVM